MSLDSGEGVRLEIDRRLAHEEQLSWLDCAREVALGDLSAPRPLGQKVHLPLSLAKPPTA